MVGKGLLVICPLPVGNAIDVFPSAPFAVVTTSQIRKERYAQ
jgi:hypothetical protein